MLKLRRLELSGFKSFVDPTDLEFSAGTTAIVGPNGCGKSNVSDAITWALGEQSAKSLRGATMEDVIFNGTDGRRPLGMAEVTLALDTEPGAAGSENGQMVLSRRVFRSGESQYRLNGKVVRLKDFRDLLMDTGLGLRAYSVIEQGRIGMILSGKPQERRRLLEEAAGVTRYRNRQRVAELKLEEAQANLLRLNDIIAEIERVLRTLKRQAGAAKRLQEKRAEARRLLHLVLTRRRQGTDLELSALATAIETDNGADSELAATISREEAALARARGEVDALAAELAGRHRRHAERGAFIEGRQRLIKEQRQTALEAEAQLAAGDETAARRAAERRDLAAALTSARERAATARHEHDEAAAAVRADDEQLAAAEAAAAGAEHELERLRSAILAAQAELTGLRNQLHREQIETEKGSYQSRRLGEQLTLWRAHTDEAAAELGVARAETEGAAFELVAEEAALETALAAAAALQEELGQARARERELAHRLEASRHRQGVLAELSAAHSERRSAWVDALAASGCAAPALLGDTVQPATGWERGLDSFLGDLADAAWIDEPGSALELVDTLATQGVVGRLLVPADETPPAIEDPAILSTLADALGLDARRGAALPPGYLVATPAEAQRLARRHPGVAFIARDRMWARAGELHLQGESALPGLLERRRESALLVAQIVALEEDRAAATALAAERTVAALAAEERVAAGRAVCGERRERMAAARARLGELEARHQRLTVERSTLETERDEVQRELDRVSQRERLLLADLERAAARHRDHEAAFEAAQQRVEIERTAREALRAAGATRRGRLDLLAERLRGHHEEDSRLERRDAGLAAEADRWAEEASRLATRRDALAASIAGAERDLQEALEETSTAQSTLLAGEAAIEARRLALGAAEAAIQARRQARDEVRAALGERRIRQAALRQQVEHIDAAYFEEFREAMAPAGGDGDRSGADDLATLEADLERCKRSIEQLGPVNVLAGDEYGENESRHQFLVTQRTDVVRSIDSLKNTIREINQTSSERFAATFREVNEHFGRTFAELFRGGEAEMRLLDEEDLLESGIEIVARPPGKRLQNLMLLSGGEKALTAIALLFALFRAKPSPFCILDEVDAPLDDINTLRFVELLTKMAGETQFIVITHNKLTMEAAARLYGVTMEERGVSKLVSVTLADVQPEPAAASA